MNHFAQVVARKCAQNSFAGGEFATEEHRRNQFQIIIYRSAQRDCGKSSSAFPS
jgi:hypothetical protein